MAQLVQIPETGQIVRVRQRQYLVEEVVPPPRADDATLLRLSCRDDDAQGQPLEVLWEKEVDPAIVTGAAWQDLAKRGFDPPKLFSAYLHTLRWNCVTATNPRLFQSPFRAGIRIDAYQLEPLRKALLLPRVNLFIADDVGLGKTIEAMLIARELLYRKKVKDIVVACPPSMLSQWQDEMENRFGLTFVILDKDYIARTRRERGYGVNPWSTHTRFLVSHRLLIDEDYAAPLRDWLTDLRPGSLLILDEAHHAAPSSSARYAIDSKITRAIRDIAPRFEHRLFLSATPHNGHSNSFSALLELLDPQRFCRGIPVRGKSVLEAVMVRRLKEDVRNVVGGFPERKVKQIDIDGLSQDAPELQLSELLDQYRQLREERLKDETKRKSVEDLQYLRKKMPAVKAALEKYTDDEAINHIQTRKAGGFFAPTKSVKQAELETLVACKDEIGTNRPEGDFYARALPKTAWDKPWMKAVEKVVLVHRLREVMAQVGFTRFEASVPDVEGELEMGVQAATLAREVSWLPAVENRGEGVFIQFQKAAVDAWNQKPSVRKRGRQLLEGFEAWKRDHSQSKREFPGLPYILLHSLSHLLITAMSLECGYPASSIRERVFAGTAGYGILLYTGSPDAEGTLGGLVEAGRKIAHHLKEALERGGLCSNDSVCAQHQPQDAHECRFLLGAACHGCLLIAETSCEQKNDFLDRALVVPTVANPGAEFFELDES